MPASLHLADLTDALARGRLAIAEIVGMTAAELDAVHAMALARLDVGQDAQAAELLAGLVALFPFSPRYWRAYGVALHRLRGFAEARRAYDAALALEPGHAATSGLRGEVLALLGDVPAAVRDLELACRGDDRAVARRAADLLKRLGAATTAPGAVTSAATSSGATTPATTSVANTPAAAPPAATPEPPADSDRHAAVSSAAAAAFVLHDARPLPLAASRIAMAASRGTATPLEVTAVTRPLAFPARSDDVTRTAARPPALVTDAGEGAPVAVTPRAGDTITALVERRRRSAAAAALETSEVTHTAIVRRGAGEDVDAGEDAS